MKYIQKILFTLKKIPNFPRSLIFYTFYAILPLMQPLVIILSKRVDYRHNKIQNHRYNELFKNRAQNVTLFFDIRLIRLLVQLHLLVIQEGPEWHLQFFSDEWNEFEPFQGHRDQSFVKRDDDEHFLDVHFDDRFANERCTEEGPKRDQKMAAGDAREVKQGIGDLFLNKKQKKTNGGGVRLKLLTLAQARMPRNPTLATNSSTKIFPLSNMDRSA